MVIELPQKDWGHWDDYVRAHPCGTIFHSTSWLQAVGRRVRVLVQMEDDEIQGGLALTRSRKYGLVGYHNPPYTPYGGPLFGGQDLGSLSSGSRYNEAVKGLFQSFGKVSQIDFILPPQGQDLLPYKSVGFDVSVGITHRVTPRSAESSPQIHGSKRRYLRKLLRLLDSSEISAGWDVEDSSALDLWKDTADRKGFTGNLECLARLRQSLPRENLRTLVLHTNREEVLAACICAQDERCYYSLTPATRPGLKGIYRHVGVLMYYLMISDAISSGRMFDFEGSSIEGIAEFFRKMGGQRVITYRLQRTRSFYFSGLRFLRMTRHARGS